MNKIKHIYIFVTTIIFSTCLIFILSIPNIVVLFKNHFVKKFEISIVLKDVINDKIVNEIKEKLKQNKNFSSYNITVLSKDDIWEILEHNEELRQFLLPLSSNPFSDVIKIHFDNIPYFDKIVFNNMIKTIDQPYVRKIFYDTMLVNYLFFFSEVEQASRKLANILQVILACCILIGLTFVKLNLLKILIYSFLYISIGIILYLSNQKINLYKTIDILWIVLVYLFGIVLINYDDKPQL